MRKIWRDAGIPSRKRPKKHVTKNNLRAVKKLSLIVLALGLGAAPALVASVAPAGAQTGGKEQARIVSFAFEPAERPAKDERSETVVPHRLGMPLRRIPRL